MNIVNNLSLNFLNHLRMNLHQVSNLRNLDMHRASLSDNSVIKIFPIDPEAILLTGKFTAQNRQYNYYT